MEKFTNRKDQNRNRVDGKDLGEKNNDQPKNIRSISSTSALIIDEIVAKHKTALEILSDR